MSINFVTFNTYSPNEKSFSVSVVPRRVCYLKYHNSDATEIIFDGKLSIVVEGEINVISKQLTLNDLD